jgi:hypothetical protein
MFPRIADFMEQTIPTIRGSRIRRSGGKMPVWDAFVVACGAEEELAGRSLEDEAVRFARRALAPGGGLRVSVTETARPDSDVNGFYDTGTNTFYIDDEIAAGCEYILMRRTGHLEKAKLFLESLLLHESVHWVRYRIGLPRRARKKIRDKYNDVGQGSAKRYEPGKFFERVAYGMDLDRTDVSSRFGRIVRRARTALGIKNVRISDIDRSERGIPQWQ